MANTGCLSARGVNSKVFSRIPPFLKTIPRMRESSGASNTASKPLMSLAGNVAKEVCELNVIINKYKNPFNGKDLKVIILCLISLILFFNI